MRIDHRTYARLQVSSTTGKILDNLRSSGSSGWAIRVRGAVIPAGSREAAVRLYDQAHRLAYAYKMPEAMPALLRGGRTRNRNSVRP
jgi:hypothetical protein